MNAQVDHPPTLLEGGGKVLRPRKGPKKSASASKKKKSGIKCASCPAKKCVSGKKKGKKVAGKKKTASASDGKCEWRRTAQQAMYAGDMRTVWKNKVSGEYAVRRMKVAPSGAKKYFFRRI
jgi:hypothetical protein